MWHFYLACPSFLHSLMVVWKLGAWSQGNRAALIDKEFVFVSSNLSGSYQGLTQTIYLYYT